MAEHMNQRVIAKKFGISRSSILEILPKFQGIGNVSDRLRCDHPRKLQHRIVRKLIRTRKAL